MHSLRLLSKREMLARASLLLLVTALLFVTVQESRAEAANDLAVIVNKAMPVLTLTSRDLRNIFLGTKDTWPDGTRVIAVSLPTERPETRTVLREICGMSEGDFKRYFLMMNFQGKSASPPRMVPTPGAVRAFVKNTPGAVGVIRARDVDSSVTVMSIDGIVPGAPGYKLTMSQQ